MNEQQNNKMMEEVKMKPGAGERMQRKPFIRDRKQGRLSATHVQIPVLRGLPGIGVAFRLHRNALEFL